MQTHTPKKTYLGALIMAWMFLFGMIGTALVGPNRLSIEREFGLSHETFGATFALIQILCSVIVLVVAVRLTHIDSLNALIVSLLIQMVGFVTVYFTSSVWLLMLGWMLVTFGIVIGSVCNTISADLWTNNPARGVTLLHGFNGIGKTIGPLIAAYCLLLGWRLSFLVVAAITGLIFVAFVFHKRHHVSPSPPDHSFQVRVLTSSMYWLCILPFGLIAGGDVAFATLVPLYYETVHGYTAQNASLLLMVHFVGLTLGRFIFSYLSGPLSNNAIIGLCLAFGLGIVPAVHSNLLSLHIIGLLGVGVLYSSTWATFYTQAARLIPAHARHLLDFGTALGNAIGIAFCVYISSALADHNLHLAMYFCVFALYLFGLVYYLSPLSTSNVHPVSTGT